MGLAGDRAALLDTLAEMPAWLARQSPGDRGAGRLARSPRPFPLTL